MYSRSHCFIGFCCVWLLKTVENLLISVYQFHSYDDDIHTQRELHVFVLLCICGDMCLFMRKKVGGGGILE